MKRKILMLTTLTLLMISSFMAVPIYAVAFPSLPADPVKLVATEPAERWPAIVSLSEIDPNGGYDVANSPPTYDGWCYQLGIVFNYGHEYWVTLKSSLDQATPWDKINYLLNHKMGTGIEVQIAIWLLLGFTSTDIANNGWGAIPTNSQTMFEDADDNGLGFVPMAGQKVAVLCEIDQDQSLFIELIVPPEDYEGLTPGFWKNHVDVWEVYTPETLFSDVFGLTGTDYDDMTLLEALAAKGGVVERKGDYGALVRHAVAAVLNAAHSEISYPMTIGEITSQVYEAMTNSDLTDAGPLKDVLCMNNEVGGGIDAHGNPL